MEEDGRRRLRKRWRRLSVRARAGDSGGREGAAVTTMTLAMTSPMRNEKMLVSMEDSNDDDLDFVTLVAVVVVVLVEGTTRGSATRKKTVLCSRASGMAVLARTGIG